MRGAASAAGAVDAVVHPQRLLGIRGVGAMSERLDAIRDRAWKARPPSFGSDGPRENYLDDADEPVQLVDEAQYPAVTVFGVYHRPPIKPPHVNGKAARAARKGDVCAHCAARAACTRSAMAGGPLLCEAATEAEVETGMLLQGVGS